MDVDQRAALEALALERREDLAGLSRLIGRNPAYIQQFIRRGTPRRLAEEDRRTLAAYFGVPESRLGGPEQADERPGAGPEGLVLVPLLDIGASAGPGAVAGDERPRGQIAFDRNWLRRITRRSSAALSIINVRGDSMEPMLADGDNILVDRADALDRLRDGIYVLRQGEALHVKRIALPPLGGPIAVRSDNPLYPGWECRRDEVDIIGRVIWAGRRVG